MMSPPRPTFVLAIGSLIVAGLGLRDWPIDGGRAMGFAGPALAAYGLTLNVRGPASLTLLPLPRLTLGRVEIAADPGGAGLALGDRLVIDLDPVRLLKAQAAVGGLRLEGAWLSADAAAWAVPLERVAEQIRSEGAARPRRIAVSGGRIADGEVARDLDLDFAWPFWSASAEGQARLTWRGVPTQIAITDLRPADIAARRRSPFGAAVSWPGGSLAADGTADPPGDGARLPVLAGRARVVARSLSETLAWIGQDVPLSPLAGGFALEGRFEGADGSVAWPSLRISLGQSVLEGAGSIAFGQGPAPRLSIQATLAAETLDLAPLADDIGRWFGPAPVPLALAPFTRGDLDLRISAATGRIGAVAVQDLAASVLVRDAAVEVAVNRARIEDGMVKGRMTLTGGADPAETEFRSQGSLDRVEAGGLLAELGLARWVAGPLQGHFALESRARDSVGLRARLGGRATLALDGGAITGLDLADMVHRNGAVASGALARRNGRTVIERAAITLRFTDGIGEIVEAGLLGPAVGATLQGRLSLPDRRLDARGDVALRPPADPSRTVSFTVSGPWTAPTAQTVPRGEAVEPPGRSGEATLPEALRPSPAGGLPGNARAYTP